MIEPRAREVEAEKRCPYCHGSLAADEPVRACDRCGTVHHASCAEERRRCTVLGCSGMLAGERDALDERLERHARERTHPQPRSSPRSDEISLWERFRESDTGWGFIRLMTLIAGALLLALIRIALDW